MTSVWAWLYCLSAWFVRLFTRLGLRRLFDIQENPVKQIALVGAVLMVLAGVLLGPVLKPERGGFANAFDDLVCRLDLEACFHAARIANDEGMTVHFMQVACDDEAEHGNCAERLASFFPTSERLVYDIWRRACDGGFPRACNAYGYALEFGEGVAMDLGRAVALYERACDDAYMPSCYNLGLKYEQGQGVAVDLMRAMTLYEQACAGGDMRGCNNLGTMYEHGEAVVVDLERAAVLYERACNGSNWRGCHNLGSMYEHGQGVVVDHLRAVALYERACERNLESACLSAQRLSKMIEASES